MDFTSAIKYKQEEISNLLNQLKDAQKETITFLNKCKDVGIKTVSIGMKTDKIKSTKDWPFSHSNSCFADEKNKDGTWPAIWSVCTPGCGNTGQHSNDNSRLIDGVYELRNGKWYQA